MILIELKKLYQVGKAGKIGNGESNQIITGEQRKKIYADDNTCGVEMKLCYKYWKCGDNDYNDHDIKGNAYDEDIDMDVDCRSVSGYDSL